MLNENKEMQIVSVNLSPELRIKLVKLWVIKAGKLKEYYFHVIHKYKHHYFLQDLKGIRVCATKHEIRSNSRKKPMFFY